MFFELIAAVVAGILGAGLVLIVNLITRGMLPKWVMPVTAGVAMIGFAILMEYTWFDRTKAEFPEGVEITVTHEARGFWRPWTYVWPLVDRFAAVDLVSIRTNESAPDQRIANLLFFGRWSSPSVVPAVFDCSRSAMAPLLDTVEIDDNGVVTKAHWGAMEADDPALKIVCKEEESDGK